jgi:hypothetical protein
MSDLVFIGGHSMTAALPYRREAYRLWFEYLRVALKSAEKEVQDALKRSKEFYAPWGDVSNLKFNAWWKDKGHLFEDKYVVRQLPDGEKPNDPDSLVVEIPLTQSPTKLTTRVRAIIQDAWASREQQSRKSKRRPTSQYQLSAGAEPKLRAVREMLTVYRDAYLKNKDLRGSDLLEKVHTLYLGRKNKRWAKVPTPLLYDRKYGDNSVALRNLRRYIQKAEKIVRNVANGEFPGQY